MKTKMLTLIAAIVLNAGPLQAMNSKTCESVAELADSAASMRDAGIAQSGALADVELEARMYGLPAAAAKMAVKAAYTDFPDASRKTLRDAVRIRCNSLN